ncbi:ShlB/FhaC/HecB family hemolysin secretion/activation protein [Horticoccus sp. 23ND18S-11]|uniref:ShlB/FhaC/HecB family hemolysin secretion/activation protein n=1 Tax=Horticoccus sp. 23ND18S-11 TaxID=3391832 RepID=UPI0039C900A9
MIIFSRIRRLACLAAGTCVLLRLSALGATPSDAPAAIPATTAAPPAAPAAPAVAGHVLRKIWISESVETAEKFSPTAGEFVVLAPSLPPMDAAELNRRLAIGDGRVIDERLLAAIAQVIELFFRQFDYPAAQAIIPNQNISTGILRVIVLTGTKSEPVTAATRWKIRNIKMDGARWFSESLLREKLRIEQGGMVQFGELDRAISWTNNNPYRRVQVKLEPVPNTGEADLIIAVKEALPLRVVTSYDNTGNVAIGKSRYAAAVSYANLWGLDHQASYQFLTTDQPKFFKAHGIDYRIPLRWRHYLQFSASYVQARPEFYEGLFVQEGETVTSDLRYSIPVRAGDNPIDVYAAINFKESNNNLAYGGTSVQATKTDIFQLTLGGSLVRRDKRGAWAFGATVTASPGGINSRNSDRAFDANLFDRRLDSARFGAKARYIYGGVTFQRLLNLAPGWDFFARGAGQVSQANLLASEQLSIGGASSVRGYNENIFSGDHGYVFSNELLAPAIKLQLPKLSKSRGPLETRFIGFFDGGNTAVRHKFAIDPKRVALAGAGLGLRMTLATNFSLNADYGWQVNRLPYPVEERSRGHIRAMLAF